MRFIKLVLALALAVSAAFGQITLVNNNAVDTTGVYVIATPTSGNVLTACAINRSNGSSVTSITQLNVAWTLIGRANSVGDAELWYGIVSGSPGSTATIVWSTGTNVYHQISEFSGVATSTPVDGSVAGNTGFGTTATSGSYTTTNAADLLLGCAMSMSATVPGSPNNSFNALQAAGNATGPRSVASAYRIVVSTGTFTVAWTIGSSNWAAVVAGLKSNGGGGGTALQDMIGHGIIPVAR